MAIAADLIAKAQAFVDRKYVARANVRQKKMGLSYITAEREDLAMEIARFSATETALRMTNLRQRHEKLLAGFRELVEARYNPFEPDNQSGLYKRMKVLLEEEEIYERGD